MSAAFVDTRFPDPTRTDIDWNAPCPSYGWPNFAFRSHASSIYYPCHRGALSIKCAFGGQEVYEIDGRRAAVDDSAYLILNDGQYYASYIDAPTRVESFCIFFHSGFARSVLRSVSATTANLLDEPMALDVRPLTFLDRLYPHDEQVSPLLGRIRTAIIADIASPMWLEEQFHWLLERMVVVHTQVAIEAERLPALRHSTRTELYQRLCWAREYIDAEYHRPLSLMEIAAAACLSPHHFLRLFRQFYRLTPHQYLTQRRLKRAQQLLAQPDLTVLDICLAVGFSSPNTFSHLFRRHYGLSPQRWRQQAGAR